MPSAKAGPENAAANKAAAKEKLRYITNSVSKRARNVAKVIPVCNQLDQKSS
jgi:hypothetical protein